MYDPYTRIDLMHRLIRGMETFSRTWTDEIDVTGDMRTLGECAAVYASKVHSLSRSEYFSRLEEVYIELLNEGYRIKRFSRSGTIYFESPGGTLLRVSDHARRDAWYRPNNGPKLTLRIDQENWIVCIDQHTKSIKELELKQ